MKATLPFASDLQSAGTQVPEAPAFCPVTVKSTSWPTTTGVPLTAWTFAVTVWLVPIGLVASSGLTEMTSELTTIDEPAIRM